MIEKLESAGLGFYVKASETQQKLGKFTFYYIARIITVAENDNHDFC